MPDPTEWVEMTHPDVHVNDELEPARVSREAFDAVWQPKGWALAGAEPAQPAAIAPPSRPRASTPTATTTET